MKTISPNSPIRRPNSFPACGRLIALPTSRELQVGQSLELLDAQSIDFPSMPDSIDIVRSAEYKRSNSPYMPDGIHVYQHTTPLEIPFSFSLHAFDKVYCPNGPYTLLMLAARLHSFILPIDKSKGTIAIRATEPEKNNSDDAHVERSRQADTTISVSVPTGRDKVFFPVTCRLELIFTEQHAPGIACTGYVKDVAAKLKGPWLRGPGKSSGLPSACDFSFTFVHLPGHGNAFSDVQGNFNLQPQAYANTIRNQFYNTRQLVQVANYQGFDDEVTSQPNPLNEAT